MKNKFLRTGLQYTADGSRVNVSARTAEEVYNGDMGTKAKNRVVLIAVAAVVAVLAFLVWQGSLPPAGPAASPENAAPQQAVSSSPAVAPAATSTQAPAPAASSSRSARPVSSSTQGLQGMNGTDLRNEFNQIDTNMNGL